MKRYGLFLFTLLLLSQANAQTVQFSGWLASFNTIKLSNRLSLHFDGQLRSTDGWGDVRTVLLRPGLNVRLNGVLTATAGYAFVAARTSLSGVSKLLAEHRGWQQLIAVHKLSNVSVQHRLRFEERFLPNAVRLNNDLEADGYSQAFRARYFIRGIIPFGRGPSFTKGPFASLQNEVFFNTGNKSAVSRKAFDQNRAYGSLGYRFKKLDAELGYLNQYTVLRSGFANNHILQLAVYKRL